MGAEPIELEFKIVEMGKVAYAIARRPTLSS